jgi:ABC-type transporter Mla subunit MlaD
MPSKEELSDQLDLTTKIAVQIQAMAKAADEVDASYKTQLETVTKLQDAFAQIDTKEAVKGVTALAKALEDVQKQVKEIGDMSIDYIKRITKETKPLSDIIKATPDFLDKFIATLKLMNRSFTDTVKASDKLGASFRDIATSSTAATAAMPQPQQMGEVIELLKNISNVLNEGLKGGFGSLSRAGNAAFNKLKKGAVEVGKELDTKLPKSLTIGAAALSGFGQGIRNVVAMTSSLGGFFSTFIGGLVSVAASIVAIPFKIFEGLIDFAAKAMTGISELAQAMEELRKQFGAFYGPTNKAIIDTSISLKGFAATGLSAWRVFGNMAERLNYIRELVTGMGTSFNLLRNEMEKNGGAILAYQKGLGLTAESMKAVAQKSASMGDTAGDTMKDMTKYSYALGKALNLDAKVISREMGEAMKDVGHFGTTSTKVMAESVGYVHKYGLELKDVTGTLDKFDSFDEAAEHTANLSQAFGVNIDAMAMMKASAEGDVGKQTEILKKAFREQGVDASKFNNVQRGIIRDQTGMSDAAIQAAFSLKQQGASLNDVRKAGGKAAATTMTQEQAMSKLSDAIERMVKAGGTQHGGFWDQFVQGFLNGIQATRPFRDMIIEIKRALIQTMFAGVQAGRAFVKYFPGVSEIFQNIAASMKPITALFRSLSAELKVLFEGKIDIGRFLDNMKAHFNVFLDQERGPLSGILGGFKKFMLKMSELVGTGIKYLVEHLTTALKEGTEFLKDPKKYLAAGVSAAGGAKTGLSFVMEILDPLIEAVKDPALWEGLWSAFKGFASAFWGLLWNKAIKPMLGAIPSGFWLGMGAIFFGPAVGRSLLGVGINVVGGALKNVFLGAVKKAPELAEKAAETAASKGGMLSKMIGPLLGNPYVAVAAAIAALTTIGVGMSRGVEKFKDKIAKDIGDDSDKKIGAATAGIVQMLSFGSIGDEAAGKMAESLTKYSEMLNKGIESLFGKNFASDVKAMVSTAFDSLIDLGDIFRKLFSGDFKGAFSSFGKFMFDAAKFAVEQLKFVLVTLPEKVIDWMSSAVGALADWLDKLFQPGASNPSVVDGLIDGIKSIGDRVLPLVSDIPGRLMTMLGDKLIPLLLRLTGSLLGFFVRIPAMIFEGLQGAFNSMFGGTESGKWINAYILDPMKNSLYEFGNFIPYFAKVLGTAVAGMTEYVKAKATGGDTTKIEIWPKEGITKGFEDYKKTLTEATKNVVSANADAAKEVAAGAPKLTEKSDVPAFLSAASQTVESMGRLKEGLSKVSDKEIAQLKESFTRVVGLFQDDSLTNVKLDKVNDLSKTFGGIGDLGKSYSEMSNAVVTATKSIGKNSVAPALEAVHKMIKVANDLNSALADGNLNKIDIKAKLENVAKAVGLGGKSSYSVDTGKNVVITVNMTVTMDAASVEKAIIYNSKSIITDRLNFATSQPTQKAGDDISPGVDAQYPVRSAGK